MYPDNLTRAETRARAELIETSAYRVDIDLTAGGSRTARRTSARFRR